MVTSFLPLTDHKGLESSTLGLNFLVLPEHFWGPEMELLATCRAAMPSIHGMELPIERHFYLVLCSIIKGAGRLLKLD